MIGGVASLRLEFRSACMLGGRVIAGNHRGIGKCLSGAGGLNVVNLPHPEETFKTLRR